jgi:hypothetical protein
VTRWNESIHNPCVCFDRVASAVPALFVALASGCSPSHEDDGSAVGNCDYRETEVSLDAQIGDETPRAVIELLERPADGSVTWYPGDGELVTVTGASGETTYHVAAAYDGGPIEQRDGANGLGEPGEGGDRITCLTVWVFDVEIEIETADGALAEAWRGEALYEVSGTLGGAGSLSVRIDDPRPFGGTLSVTENRDLFEQWKTHELFTLLAFSTFPAEDALMHGVMQYHLANLGNGEGELATVDIAEFAW